MQNRKIALITPKEAVKMSVRVMDSLGFYKSSGSDESNYFAKRGSPFRIRVSNHKDIAGNSDVLVDIIFDYDTIKQDVETRLSQGAKQFSKEIVFRKNIKK